MAQLSEQKTDTCPKCGKSLKEAPISPKFLKPGTILQGKFIVGYPIGAGGFGNTYIGWNQLLLRKVAIKEFYPEQYITRADNHVTVTVPNKDLQPRFKKGLWQFLEEARSVAALQDIKGVVEISNFFEENGTGYIVMEYLEGMDVKTILKKSGNKKDYEWCRRVILTVLDTLKEIHKRGVLHRDIAPDNIFVTREGVIKLIDFGAAKHASALANTNADIMLKVGYAPIEQYGRTMPQGPYTDLYAVAAMFYRMLTGQKPIPANQRQKKDTLITPSEMGIELPQQAEMAIMVCLNLLPQYRLQSAEEFMEALDGKYFKPVYEPEWILPPVKEKKSFVGWISSLPVAAKATLCFFVICLLGGGIAGTVAVTKNNTEQVANLESDLKEGQLRIEDYQDKTYEEAVEALKRQGFENITCEYALSEKEKDIILKQSIEAGNTVELDENMVFTVSGGMETYTMPDCTGMTEQEIIAYFTGQNFQVKVYTNPYRTDSHTEKAKNSTQAHEGTVCIQYEFIKDIVKGVCYEQSISAGDETQTATDLTFTLSMGGEEADFEVELPDFTGMTKEQVEEAVKDCGLTEILQVEYEEEAEYSDSVEKDCVLSQSLAEGEIVNLLKDSEKTVTFTLSAGARPKRKPTPVQPTPEQAQPEQAPAPTPTPAPSAPTPVQPAPKEPSVYDVRVAS